METRTLALSQRKNLIPIYVLFPVVVVLYILHWLLGRYDSCQVTSVFHVVSWHLMSGCQNSFQQALEWSRRARFPKVREPHKSKLTMDYVDPVKSDPTMKLIINSRAMVSCRMLVLTWEIECVKSICYFVTCIYFLKWSWETRKREITAWI